MAFFRGGDNEDVRKELQGIEDAKKEKDQHPEQSLFGIATLKDFWKPFSCVGIIFILFRLSSFSILSHYTAPFLDRAEITLDPLLAAVLIGVLRLVSSLAAFLIFSFISKRTAFIFAGIASTLGMLLGKSTSSAVDASNEAAMSFQSLSTLIYWRLYHRLQSG